jgi:hypothetical protein
MEANKDVPQGDKDFHKSVCGQCGTVMNFLSKKKHLPLKSWPRNISSGLLKIKTERALRIKPLRETLKKTASTICGSMRFLDSTLNV